MITNGPLSIRKQSVQRLQSSTATRPLSWAPQFGLFDRDKVVSQNEDYKRGLIVPMDPSSYLAVHNLSLVAGEHVLDLCCAPGVKMVLMADALFGDSAHAAAAGSLTGVDVSRERLGAAVRLGKKYKIPNVRLFVADGRKFCTPPHLVHDHASRCGQTFKDIYAKPASRPLYSASVYRKQRGRLAEGMLYDKVIVDAQCTHDGSVKHIRKHIENGWREFSPEHYSHRGLVQLYDLQRSLLANGFRLLRPGGILVYSTCSQSHQQNEQIILDFMRGRADCQILEPLGPADFRVAFGDAQQYGALRIAPTPNMGGGFFVCRLTKTTP